MTRGPSLIGRPRIGVLQLLVLAVVLACLVWTYALIALTIHPNHTVNRIMDTEAFDDGAFWLLIEPPKELVVLGVAGFALMFAGYISVILRFMWRDKSATSRHTSIQKVYVGRVVEPFKSALRDISDTSKSGSLKKSAAVIVSKLSNKESSTRKFAMVWLKLGDIAVQVVLLVQILEMGLPIALVYTLTGIIFLNSIASAALVYAPESLKQSGVVEELIDTISTFLIAIAFPMLVVAHSFSTFTFDRARYALNLQVFPRGEFETLARAIADPVQVTVVLKSLNSLRIRSALDFFTRVGTHVALIYRLHCLMGILRASRGHTFHSAYPHRHRVGVLFVVFPILLTLFVYFSISTAKQACSYHPECAVYALRWTRIREDDRTQCPCIALIDGNIAISTFAEWVAPRNVTEKVSQLATTGHLEIVQLLNRQLIAFPDELRRCTNLQQLSLYYAETATLPEWVAEFASLEYLQIEGKPTLPGLLSLPDDMFKNMHSLSFMHLATHSFRQLPSFHGLVNLRALTLAVLLALESLPDFDSLKKLERLVMIFLPSVDSIPDMSAIEDLQSFVILYRGAMCCNGFLDNNCDLTNSMCQVYSPWRFPMATCLPTNRTEKIATQATRSAFTKFAASVCIDPLTFDTGAKDDYPSEANMLQCNGTMYRQCTLPGHSVAMCYNARLMPITCNSNMLPIEMRRRQIEAGVGDPCDPKEEAWLGCKG